MNLNAFAAQRRLKILENLKNGLPPSEGSFDESTWKEGKVKGEPQMGTTRFQPDAILVEFIYPDPTSTATILTVRLDPPERIVFLPVPDWVVESIWQGDVDGSFHFESDAMRLLHQFSEELAPEKNVAWFGPRQPKRRE
jgi:hypothetical protein